MNRKAHSGLDSRPERNADLNRLQRLRERWSRWSLHPLGKPGWEALASDNLGAMVVLIGLGFSIAFTPFDLGIWIPRLEPYDLGLWALEPVPELLTWIRSVPNSLWLGIFLVLLPVNVWAVDRVLARWDPPGPSDMRKRALRLLLSAIPLVGLGFPRIWQGALRQDQEGGTDREDEHCEAAFEPLPSRTRGFVQRLDRTARNLSLEHLGALFLINALVIFTSGLALAFSHDLYIERALAVTSLCAFLHLVAWLNMSYWLEFLAKRSARAPFSVRGGRYLALLWLVPAPYVAALGALWLAVRCTFWNSDQTTLTEAIYDKRKNLYQSPKWSRLEADLRTKSSSATWWQRWRDRSRDREPPRAASKVDEEVLRLCRRKSLALGFEAALLVMIGAFIAEKLGLAGTFHTCFQIAFLLPLGVASLGILILVTHFLARWARVASRANSYPWVSALVASQLSWSGGLLAGLHLFRRDGESFGAVLVSIGALGLLLQTGPIFLRFVVSVPLPRQPKLRREAPWLFLFSAFLVCGQSVAKGEDHGIYAALAFLAALSSPLWSVVLGALSLPWMLRPWRVHHLWTEDLRFRDRVLHGLVTLTILVPGGGLVSPWWVLLRLTWNRQDQVLPSGSRDPSPTHVSDLESKPKSHRAPK